MRRQSVFRFRILGAGILVLACLASLPAGFYVPSAKPESGDHSPPLPIGETERLVYDIDWNPPWYLIFLPPMRAGEATLTLAGKTRYRDQDARKITFDARSSGTFARLAGISVDDHYEFTTDAETFCTLCVSKKEREGKRMRDIDVVYLPGSRKLHLREVDVSAPAPRVLRDQDYEDIPPCVKDLFSALYHVRRGVLEVGSLSRVLVGDNQTVKEVEVRVEKKERVSTPSGDFDAWRVETVAVMGGLFKNGGQFRMWLSADDRKLPVKFEVKVKYGKVTGRLREAHF